MDSLPATPPAQPVFYYDLGDPGCYLVAERVLSGESGSLADTASTDGGARVATTDREHDCVPEVSAAGLPSALADSVTFTLTPYTAQ